MGNWDVQILWMYMYYYVYNGMTAIWLMSATSHTIFYIHVHTVVTN